MERWLPLTQFSLRLFTPALIIFSFVACGNGGRIEFRPDLTPRKSKGAAITMVPASEALVVEVGETPATGYHAKIQLNPIKGTTLEGGGHSLKLKHTVRNR